MWKQHPMYPAIKCSDDGRIRIKEKKFNFIEQDGVVQASIFRSNKRIPVADMILACFNPCPGIRTQYRIVYKDGDIWNLRLDNLEWERLYVR